jgi:hypothetical protein
LLTEPTDMDHVHELMGMKEYVGICGNSDGLVRSLNITTQGEAQGIFEKNVQPCLKRDTSVVLRNRRNHRCSRFSRFTCITFVGILYLGTIAKT